MSSVKAEVNTSQFGAWSTPKQTVEINKSETTAVIMLLQQTMSNNKFWEECYLQKLCTQKKKKMDACEH